MPDRDELLAYLGLPPEATEIEIESAYLEKRTNASRRLGRQDLLAADEIQRLDRVRATLKGLPDSPSQPPLVLPSGSERRYRLLSWESYCALGFGIAAILSVARYWYTYRADIEGSSRDVLLLLQSPDYYFVFLLSLAAEMFSQPYLRAKSRADFLEMKGLDPGDRVDSQQLTRALTGRWMGRVAAITEILLLLMVLASFFRFLRGR